MDVLKEYDEKMKPLRRIVGVAMEVYNEWGAGLLESAYEAGMKHLLDKDPTIKVERQKPLPMYWKDEQLEDHFKPYMYSAITVCSVAFFLTFSYLFG